jgi:hypothetical protein
MTNRIEIGDIITGGDTLWATSCCCNTRIILGSDLWCHWVKWPGGGERPWPIGAYLGTAANGRRMWQTISPYSRAVIRTHLPDGAEVVAGPYTLHHSHFPPVAAEDVGGDT